MVELRGRASNKLKASGRTESREKNLCASSLPRYTTPSPKRRTLTRNLTSYAGSIDDSLIIILYISWLTSCELREARFALKVAYSSWEIRVSVVRLYDRVLADRQWELSKKIYELFVSVPKFTHLFIYQTRETVFHRDIHKPRRELKIRRAAEYFCRNSMCSDSRWNTDSSVWYIFSIETKAKEKQRRKSSKSMLIKTGYPNLLHGCDWLCLNFTNY